MSNPEYSPELAARFRELGDICHDLADQYSGHRVIMVRNLIPKVLDAHEESYETGEEVDIPRVDPIEKQWRDLNDELSELTVRKDEVRRLIREGNHYGGAHYHLKQLYRLIRKVRAEIEMFNYFPEAESAVAYEDGYWFDYDDFPVGYFEEYYGVKFSDQTAEAEDINPCECYNN